MANPLMSPLSDRDPDATSRLSEPLESWKEIAAYLGKGVTTVRRWEREEGLPVRRQEHIRRGSVVAYRSELDEWRRSRTTQNGESAPRWKMVRNGALAVVGLGAVVSGLTWNTQEKWAPATEFLQLTADRGSEGSVSLAPGGQRFVYTSGGRVFLKETGVEPPRELYQQPGSWICCVQWSPDGRQVAISHSTTTVDWQISLIDTSGKLLRRLGPGGPAMEWRPDGKALLYAHRPTSQATSAIFEHDLSNSRIRQLSFPPPGFWGDIAVAVEDDGRRFAVTRYSRPGRGDVYLSGYGSKAASRLTQLQNWVVGLDWLPQGQGIVFGGIVAGRQGLHRVAADGAGAPALIGGTEGVNVYPHAVSTGRHSLRVGFVHEFWNPDLKMLDPRTGAVTPVAASTQPDESPDVSGDGQLVFVSSRGGSEDVWVCPPGCGQLRRITNFKERQFDITPRWSPDGRQLALAASFAGHAQLMVLNSHGDDVHILSRDKGEARPSWSLDGRFVYFQSDRSGRPEIWRIPAAGGAPAMQVTHDGGIEAFEVSGGAGIFFIRTNERATVYRQSLAGGAAAPVNGLPAVQVGDWRPIGDTVLYWSETSLGPASLHELDLATSQSKLILSGITGKPIHGLSANRRGDIVWSERGTVQKDIQAVDLKFPSPWTIF